MAQKQNKVRLEARTIKFGLINAKISLRTLSVNRGNVAQGDAWLHAVSTVADDFVHPAARAVCPTTNLAFFARPEVSFHVPRRLREWCCSLSQLPHLLVCQIEWLRAWATSCRTTFDICTYRTLLHLHNVPETWEEAHFPAMASRRVGGNAEAVTRRIFCSLHPQDMR